MEPSSATDRILDKLDELKETNKGICESVQKLIQYVLVIGALNGSVTAGKLVAAVTEKTSDRPISQERVVTNDSNATFDTREAEPRPTEAVN